jgi:hypothetical protein
VAFRAHLTQPQLPQHLSLSAGLADLVPPAGALGFAGVAASWPSGYQVAMEGDLEGQVGDEITEAVRGKGTGVADPPPYRVAGDGEGDPAGSMPSSAAAPLIRMRIAWQQQSMPSPCSFWP